MSSPERDSVFERSLRAVLADRDPGPAPERLRARLAEIGAAGVGRRTVRGRVAWLRALAPSEMAAAACMALAVALGSVAAAGSLAGAGAGSLPAGADPARFEGLTFGGGSVPVYLLSVLALLAGAFGAWLFGLEARRWRRLAWLVAGGLLGVLFGLSAWVANAGFVAPFATIVPGAGNHGIVSRDPEWERTDDLYIVRDRPVLHYTARDGATDEVLFTVRNDGPIPIRITGFGQSADRTYRISGILVNNAGGGHQVDGSLPLGDGVTVAPGVGLVGLLQVTYADCSQPGAFAPTGERFASADLELFALEYEVLGLRRTALVELDFTASFDGSYRCLSLDPAP